MTAMKKIISAAAAVCCLICMLSLFACGKKDVGDSSIVGKWKYSLNADIRDVLTEVMADTSVYDDVFYEFNENGTGSTYTKNNPEKMEFTYTFDGSKIHIINEYAEFDVSAKLDGDTLAITENDNTVEFERQ